MLLSSTSNGCANFYIENMQTLSTDKNARQFIMDFVSYKEWFEKTLLNDIKLSVSNKKRDLHKEKEFIMALDKFNKESVN